MNELLKEMLSLRIVDSRLHDMVYSFDEVMFSLMIATMCFDGSDVYFKDLDDE